jgi:FkbM family methyltransferase
MAANRRKSHRPASASPPQSASTSLPHAVVHRPAASPQLDPSAPLYEVRAAPPRIFDASDELLSRARMQWQFGEWPSLLTLDLLAIEHHPARAELALLSGCAALQTGRPEVAQRYLTAAETWDCHPALMARLLLAGVANSLARYHALKGNSATSETYFLEAASALGGDPRLAARARQQQELLSLPPLPSPGQPALAAPVPEPSPPLPEPTPAPSSHHLAHANPPTEPEANPFQPGIRSYAQNFEDVMLWRALKHVEDGFYIDVGAQHPVQDSVSKAFYEKGWRGIHVEATSAYARLLRQDRPDETVIEAALSNQHGTLPFFEIPETGLSTGDPEIAARHQKQGFEVQDTSVPTLTLSDVFALAGDREIHWLKIDVEGMEKQVLEGWGNHPKRPWILVIEATLPNTTIESHHEWEHHVLTLGYLYAYKDGLSRFYLHKRHSALSEKLNLPPNVFDGYTRF